MALTLMMKHYLETKAQHSDCILFYRLGDFYEMFFEDAELCSKELELTLTGKGCGLENRAPMCGIPHHSANQYIQKLIEKGYKVAICEQLTQPKKGVKIVERGVVRIITPGTVFDSEMLDDEKNNFIASVYVAEEKCSVSWIDVSTGEFQATLLEGKNFLAELSQALIRISPSEIITNSADYLNQNLGAILQKNLPQSSQISGFDFLFSCAKSIILNQFKGENLRTLGLENSPEICLSIAALVHYLNETQKQFLCHINKISIIDNKKFMILDSKARKNLEILENSVTGKKQGSLLQILNHCETSMGARLLRSYLNEPLIDSVQIAERLDAVEELASNQILLASLKDEMHYIRDIERLTSRIASNQLLPRQAKAILESFEKVPAIYKLLSNCKSSLIVSCAQKMQGLDDVVNLLKNSIHDNPPLSFKDGYYIKSGFNAELDDYRNAKKQGNVWLADLEAKEKQLTNIKNLKIGYNSNFGYYLEVLNSQKELVPYRYVRKQTTISAERYITDELKQLEEKILNSEENASKLEYKIFCEIREYLLNYVLKFQEVAKAIAKIDVLSNFARISNENRYVRPEINNDGIYDIVDGRHPVIEKNLKDGVFNPNNTFLSNDQNIMLITGPNMAGKSTYMRQVALITLMAHVGCFVPAKSANISITDRIFTRIGASDDIAFGQSTFMVEMVESTTILNEATDKSLIILDEVGRGTSTYDGLSIAYAIIDYLSNNIGAKTLFATHYHELIQLEKTHKGVTNYSVAVKEYAGEIIFLHKIIKGGADRSFGIEVAQLAGLPKEVVKKAKNYLVSIETTSENGQIKSATENNGLLDLTEKSVINAINSLNIDSVSPMKALELLATYKSRLEDK